MRSNPASGDMSAAECWEKLRAATFANLALSARALPVILPVQYQVQAGLIVMCLGDDVPFDPVIEDAVAAFAVDSLDPDTASGWMVHVQGTLHRLGAGATQDGRPRPAGVIVGLEPFALTGWHVELCQLDRAGRSAPLT